MKKEKADKFIEAIQNAKCSLGYLHSWRENQENYKYNVKLSELLAELRIQSEEK